ncbi:hypothetical protein SBA2_380023 [Acidobacteriia bacterium SbA2]|nr:hypothetical protein SBA2_380023 [Acidobacteriia bacterium SbA2]
MIKSAVFLIVLHQPFQRLVIGNRTERAVNSTDYLAEENVSGRSPQQIPSVRASEAVDKARHLQMEEDQLQEFLRDVFGGGNIGDLRRFGIVSRQSDHCLQRIKALL